MLRYHGLDGSRCYSGADLVLCLPSAKCHSVLWKLMTLRVLTQNHGRIFASLMVPLHEWTLFEQPGSNYCHHCFLIELSEDWGQEVVCQLIGNCHWNWHCCCHKDSLLLSCIQEQPMCQLLSINHRCPRHCLLRPKKYHISCYLTDYHMPLFTLWRKCKKNKIYYYYAAEQNFKEQKWAQYFHIYILKLL